jgi:hypothetical protein
MNVIPAWESCYTGRGIVVGVVDDGVFNHPDLNLVRYLKGILCYCFIFCCFLMDKSQGVADDAKFSVFLFSCDSSIKKQSRTLIPYH